MKLLQVRDEAFSASAVAHARMQREWDIYHNLDYPDEERILRTRLPRSQKSMDPLITKGVNRLVSPYVSQLASMEIQADRSEVTNEDRMYVEDIQNWHQMMEDADNETETRQTLVLHNLVGGTAIAKTYYDTRTRVVRSEAVNPQMIAIDGGASRIDLSDAMVVCQQYWFPEYYLKRYYDWEPSSSVKQTLKRFFRYNQPTHRLDEMWIRRELLESCVDVDHEALARNDKQMFRVIFIDDEVIQVRQSPFWWPDFPYSCWRNFSCFYDNRKAQDFWGHGFPTYLIEPQKFHDEMLGAIVEAARHIPIGQAIAVKGALDPEQDYGTDSQLIELEEGHEIGTSFQKLPLDQFPVIFGELLATAKMEMQEMMPSLNPVFTGAEQGGGNASGRQVLARQYAAHSQIEDNLSRGNVMLRDRAIQRITGIQQTAKKPLSPHVWRGQLDLPDYFPEDARYIGFNVTYPDTAAMPSSPQGRMQLVAWLASLGLLLPPEELLKITKLDTAVGLTPEMFEMAIQTAPSQGLVGGQRDASLDSPMP